MIETNYAGIRIGVLTITKFSHREFGGAVWTAKCDCGENRLVRSSHFPAFKRIKSCRCSYKKSVYKKRQPKVKLVGPIHSGHCRKCDEKLPKTRYFYCIACTPNNDEYYDIFGDYETHA